MNRVKVSSTWVGSSAVKYSMMSPWNVARARRERVSAVRVGMPIASRRAWELRVSRDRVCQVYSR